MTKQSFEMKEKFSNLLLTFFSEFDVLVWNLKYPSPSYIGSEPLTFIKNAKKIKDFLVENFAETKLLTNLYNGLLMWGEIIPFLVITKSENIEDHTKKLKVLLKKFKTVYNIGKKIYDQKF